MANEILTPSQDEQGSAQHPVRAWLAPLVDILEYDDRFEVIADLPGVVLADITLTLHDGRLEIEAHRGDVGYRRAFSLPADVDGEQVGAQLDRGVLTVALPRAKPAGPRRIEVK